MMDRMVEGLRKRVRYNFEVYTTNKCRWWSETPVFYIYVDDELWFASNPQYYEMRGEYIIKNVDKSLPYHEYWEAHAKAEADAERYVSEYGLMDVYNMTRHIHEYLNVYGVQECLDSGDYILRMLAVLDRRIGKRTVSRLADNLFDEPEWFRKFIVLRAENEGIFCRLPEKKSGAVCVQPLPEDSERIVHL